MFEWQVAGDALQATVQFLVAFPETLDASAPNVTLQSFLDAVASGVFDIVSTASYPQTGTLVATVHVQALLCANDRLSACIHICMFVCVMSVCVVVWSGCLVSVYIHIHILHTHLHVCLLHACLSVWCLSGLSVCLLLRSFTHA